MRMKKALQFGAGNIGRGFIGQLFSRSGYELVFSEVDAGLVAAMNADRRYPVRVVSDSGDREDWVENARAVNGAQVAAVAAEMVDAEVVGTAVGANILPKIAGAFAAGLEARWRAGNEAPLNVILCENLVDADQAFRAMVAERLGGADKDRLTRLVGFVRASVGRMVPVMTEAMREGNPLRIWVEAYDHLPVDADAFAGRPPEVCNMERVSPFGLYVERKLYIHNMGHAASAYLGALRGYAYIWQAVGDREVADAAREAMGQSAAAIAAEWGVDQSPLLEHAEDLLRRFANKKLGDTIARVGRDLPRKLAPRDRLSGARGLCARHGLPRGRILDAIAASLLFEDSASGAVRDAVRTRGPRSALVEFCGMSEADPDLEAVVERYDRFSRHG